MNTPSAVLEERFPQVQEEVMIAAPWTAPANFPHMNALRLRMLVVCILSVLALNAQDDELPPPPPSPEDAVYDIASVQEQPNFPGGQEAMMKYLMENTRYPDEAVEAGLQGKVFVEFEVNKKGKVVSAEVKRGVPGAPMLDAEALRVVKAMPAWTPGRMNGKAVRTRFALPILFSLGYEKKEEEKK